MDTAEEELTESEKRQVTFGRKWMAVKHETQAEMRRHMQTPEMQAIFAELRERLN